MKTNLMKSILHLKDDTEYQIPLREAEKDRAKVGADVKTTVPNSEAVAKKENEADKAANEEEAIATQSQDEISQEEVTNEEEVTDEDSSALDKLEVDSEETPSQEQSSTENSNNDTTIESAPQVDTAKAALDEMKKLASQEGVIHPSLFISNFSKILGLMERAMQLQVKESGSATKESGSVTKEAPKATEPAGTTEQTKTPAEG